MIVMYAGQAASPAKKSRLLTGFMSSCRSIHGTFVELQCQNLSSQLSLAEKVPITPTNVRMGTPIPQKVADICSTGSSEHKVHLLEHCTNGLLLLDPIRITSTSSLTCSSPRARISSAWILVAKAHATKLFSSGKQENHSSGNCELEQMTPCELIGHILSEKTMKSFMAGKSLNERNGVLCPCQIH